MSATMARQGGWVQLEQSDMRFALNMAKMAKGGFSCATLEEMQQLIKKPRAEVREEKKGGVEFPGQKKIKSTMERHPAMVYKNHTAGCLPCQNGTAKNPQPCWRHNQNHRTSTRNSRTSARNAIFARNATCTTRGH